MMVQVIRLILGLVVFFLFVGCGGSDHNSSVTDENNENQLDSTTILPPDPGETGKSTLIGVDSDNDGVRDDVQIAITKLYPSDTSAKKALLKLAVEMQEAFVAQSNDNINQIYLEKLINATDCITITSSNPLRDIIYIEFAMINTEDRQKAYININDTASGDFFLIDNIENSCQK